MSSSLSPQLQNPHMPFVAALSNAAIRPLLWGEILSSFFVGTEAGSDFPAKCKRPFPIGSWTTNLGKNIRIFISNRVCAHDCTLDSGRHRHIGKSYVALNLIFLKYL